MRLPRVRFTVRRATLAVAALALHLAVVRHLSRAGPFESHVALIIFAPPGWQPVGPMDRPPKPTESDLLEHARRLTSTATLERAAALINREDPEEGRWDLVRPDAWRWRPGLGYSAGSLRPRLRARLAGPADNEPPNDPAQLVLTATADTQGEANAIALAAMNAYCELADGGDSLVSGSGCAEWRIPPRRPWLDSPRKVSAAIAGGLAVVLAILLLPVPALRLPRVRLTMPGLMAAAMIAGLVIQAAVWIRASRRYRGVAEGYSRKAGLSLQQAALREGQLPDMEGDLADAEARLRWDRENEVGRRYVARDVRLVERARGSVESAREEAGMLRREAEHLGRLARKYERAARYPWLADATDPPVSK